MSSSICCPWGPWLIEAVFKHERIVRIHCLCHRIYDLQQSALSMQIRVLSVQGQGEKCFLRILFNQTLLRWISPSECNLLLWISSSFPNARTTRITQRIVFFPILIYRLSNTVLKKSVVLSTPQSAKHYDMHEKREYILFIL